MPRKLFVLLVLLLGLLLAGCQQVDPTATASVSPTSLPPSETPSPTRGPSGSQAANCTVVSPRPTPGPTEESLFPPVSEADWTTGPADAIVTIVEYSDFQ